jgi:hypothetical protein
MKANAGHSEPGAGLAGALKLLMQLRDSSLSPNAHLRTVNPHVGDTLRDCAACGLPTQVTRKPARTMCVGGISSFGYAGTIAHAVLRHVEGEVAVAALVPLVYRRRNFPWREVSASSNSIEFDRSAPTPYHISYGRGVLHAALVALDSASPCWRRVGSTIVAQLVPHPLAHAASY